MSAGRVGKVGGLPQVNLLPPEVRAARGLKVVRRWLLAGLVLVAVLLAGGYFLSLTARAEAELERVEAQEETAALQAEQAKYAEVPALLAALDNGITARQVGMSTEVDWRPYVDAMTAVLPANVSIESIMMSGATPVLLPAPAESPLFDQSVGQLTITGRAVALPDSVALIDALNSIPGFADAWVSASVRSEVDGALFYAVTASVRVLDSAYTNRFAAPTEEEG